MFEEQIAFEKKEGSSFGPVLIILLVAGILVGSIGWVIYEQKKMLKPEEAAKVIEEQLKDKGPAMVKFDVGKVTPNGNENANDPRYRLLEKVGLVKVAFDKKTYKGNVALAPEAEKLISSFAEFKKTKLDAGTVAYSVPLANRKLVAVTNIIKISPDKFHVEYTWNWVPNALGEKFDVEGQYLKAFNSYERAQLIDKHGADFYHGAAKQGSMIVVNSGSEWKRSAE